MSKADRLRQLHEDFLVLPNAWDATSARMIARAGATAIATSSAGVAYVFGYPDGGRISRAEMLDMVRRVASAVALPVTADMEAGYGDAGETARLSLEAGAVGMNLEDAAPDGSLFSLESQVERVQAVRAAVGRGFILNARTDAYAAPGIADRLGESVKRANAYLAAGADCAFVPFVFDVQQIEELARQIKGPLNVLYGAASPPLSELKRIGVRRVSVGSGIVRAAYTYAEQAARELLTQGTCQALKGAITYAQLQELLA
ncbi:MAG TPA: isocitrate lyase/phosphoenolpyruvate mutase family protein [Myxococcales bacterium]|jgi:2-methylisocitrate lyase-like PEP mutase family enzyme